MFLRHFNLREQPFGVTPNPRFLYSSATHREALAALVYGLDSGLGFVTLTANPGMGKTTLLFEVLRRLNETAKTVFLFQTISTPADLFRALLIDLGVENPRGTLVDHQTELNQILVKHSASSRRLVIVIDEAQNLNDQVLEAVRMLSNFETGHRKLMHIVLSGQLQLAERLAGADLLQLRQRISIFAHLKPLTAAETAEYIQHRLKTAGWDGAEAMFTTAAMAMIAERSQGIPRNINNLCFNALTIACAMQRTAVDQDMVREVVADLDIASVLAPASTPTWLPAGQVVQDKQVPQDKPKKQDKQRKQDKPVKQDRPAPPAQVVAIDAKPAPESALPIQPVAASIGQQPLDFGAVEVPTAQQRITVAETVSAPATVVPIDVKTPPAAAEKPPRQWPPRGLSRSFRLHGRPFRGVGEPEPSRAKPARSSLER